MKNLNIIRYIVVVVLLVALSKTELRAWALDVDIRGSHCANGTVTFEIPTENTSGCGIFYWTFERVSGNVSVPGAMNGRVVSTSFTGTGTIRAIAHGSGCPPNGGGTQEASGTWDIYAVTSGTISLTTPSSAVCGLGGLILYTTASGNNQSYTFNIDGHSYTYTGADGDFYVPQARLSPGTHNVTVSTPSSGICPGGPATDTDTYTIRTPTNGFSANLSIVDPIVICTPTGSVTREVRVNLVNNYQYGEDPDDYTYEWYFNDEMVSTDKIKKTFTLEPGDELYAKAMAPGYVSQCLAPAKTPTLEVSQATDVNPGLAIQVTNGNVFCNNGILALESSRTGTSYLWELDGEAIGTGRTKSVQLSPVVTPGKYTPGVSEVTLHVNGISVPTNPCVKVYDKDAVFDAPVTIKPRPSNIYVGYDRDPFCSNGSSWVPVKFSAEGSNITALSISFASPGKTLADIGTLGDYTTGLDPITQKYRTSQVLTFKPTFTGGLTVTATGSGCEQVAVPTEYAVYPQPNSDITGSLEVPFGTDETVLTAPSNPNYTYLWKFNGTEISTTNTAVARESGRYYVTISESVNDCSDQGTTLVRFENSYNVIIEDVLLTDKKSNGSTINTADIEQLSRTQKTKTLDYYDGLGRLMQTVVRQGSPLGNDFVQPVIYDGMGYEVFKYLPFVSTEQNGWYKQNPVGANSPQKTFYNNAASKVAVDNSPYSKTEFEYSPEKRVLKQGSPGDAWQPSNATSLDHSVRKSYDYNLATDVYLFQYETSSSNVTLADQIYYSVNTLYANKTIDENNNAVIEYTDRSGNLVCKKVQYGTDTSVTPAKILYASTYYIYDEVGNLAVVMPPEAIKLIDQSNGN